MSEVSENAVTSEDADHDTAECARPGCTEPARPDRLMCALHFTHEPARRSA